VDLCCCDARSFGCVEEGEDTLRDGRRTSLLRSEARGRRLRCYARTCGRKGGETFESEEG
jgi:hypothetical protein